MGQTLGNAFGSRDKNATNDVLNGQVVATGTPGATTVKDPNQGLSDDQLRNRKILATGLKGASGLLSSQSGQPQQRQAQPVNFNTYGTPSNQAAPAPLQLPFYGNMGYR